MRIEVLVSTMKQEDNQLVKRMNICTDAVVINQYSQRNEHSYIENDGRIKWINSELRGLSKSRNMAIDNANAEICILADDDIVYSSGYDKKIIEQFKIHPDADIIAFQVEGVEKKFKNYSCKTQSIGYLRSMKISSVEIAFKRKSIINCNIRFNEMFGAGSKYSMGEENIFLYDCLRCGLKIKYVPVKIADLHIQESSWFKGYNEKYLIDRGAIFAAMSKKFSLFFIIQFAIRKASLFRENIHILKLIEHMFNGRNEYLDYINIGKEDV